jgi:hypothetical protein
LITPAYLLHGTKCVESGPKEHTLTASRRVPRKLWLAISITGVALTLGLSVGRTIDIDGRTIDTARVTGAVQADTCQANGSASQLVGVPDQARRTAMVAAWIMGMRGGIHSSTSVLLRGKPSDPAKQAEWANLQEQSDKAAAAVGRMASQLGIPGPAPFAPRQPLRAIPEFAPFVESPQNQTTVRLAKSYAPQVCEVYKLGLYWGFSTLYRGQDPGARNIFATEIGNYADRLKLSVDLKATMTDPSRLHEFTAVMAEAERISKTVAEYWSAH